MSTKKVDIAKEAKKTATVAAPEEEKITDAILIDVCPKELVAAFKKAKTPAARADFLYELDKARLEQGKKAEALKKMCSKLEAWFIQELPNDKATGISGKVGCVNVVSKERPAVEDWDKFYAHIKKKNEFELLNRAVNTKAMKERWEAGKEVPGVGHYKYKDVSLTKAKASKSA